MSEASSASVISALSNVGEEDPNASNHGAPNYDIQIRPCECFEGADLPVFPA